MAQWMGSIACEDPYIWWDKAGGVYRLLSHACLPPPASKGGTVGGHMFSRDGLAWSQAWTDNQTWVSLSLSFCLSVSSLYSLTPPLLSDSLPLPLSFSAGIFHDSGSPQR